MTFALGALLQLFWLSLFILLFLEFNTCAILLLVDVGISFCTWYCAGWGDRDWDLLFGVETFIPANKSEVEFTVLESDIPSAE